eukprot:CAMPEP_0119527318 /NCGR_PEP_ID=MMETSP1344-20130328/41750_1 /TAXON_ID=236787 /ORGANISM="Florenciella parvula, Strain CCMP2471" /LENGTH=247 /DNA_ID=CAMNT_0007566491 /DNA_START=312 /DNA_END=1055 /DNA_ORIENTATION=+
MGTETSGQTLVPAAVRADSSLLPLGASRAALKFPDPAAETSSSKKKGKDKGSFKAGKSFFVLVFQEIVNFLPGPLRLFFQSLATYTLEVHPSFDTGLWGVGCCVGLLATAQALRILIAKASFLGDETRNYLLKQPALQRALADKQVVLVLLGFLLGSWLRRKRLERHASNVSWACLAAVCGLTTAGVGPELLFGVAMGTAIRVASVVKPVEEKKKVEKEEKAAPGVSTWVHEQLAQAREGAGVGAGQ